MPKLPAAAVLAVQRFGKRTRILESTPTVSATAPGTEILGFNANRIAWFTANAGANEIHITRRVVPTTTLGALLAASGGVISEDAEEVGEVIGLPVRAIATTADQQIYVYEVSADVAQDEER